VGLDVTALSKAKRVGGFDSDEDAIAAYNGNGFNRMDGVAEGRYVGADEFGFAAGSYGGYNAWREWLSKKFLGVDPQQVWDAPERFAGRPFVELINFADNEGAFGPVTSAKLAKDFQEHASELKRDDDWNVRKYLEWQKAFELASDEGLVVLH